MFRSTSPRDPHDPLTASKLTTISIHADPSDANRTRRAHGRLSPKCKWRLVRLFWEPQFLEDHRQSEQGYHGYLIGNICRKTSSCFRHTIHLSSKRPFFTENEGKCLAYNGFSQCSSSQNYQIQELCENLAMLTAEKVNATNFYVVKPSCGTRIAWLPAKNTSGSAASNWITTVMDIAPRNP